MKNKFWSLLLSVVLATSLWMYVTTTVSPNSKTTVSDIPVVFEGESWLLENRNLMITDGMDTTVDPPLYFLGVIVSFGLSIETPPDDTIVIQLCG